MKSKNQLYRRKECNGFDILILLKDHSRQAWRAAGSSACDWLELRFISHLGDLDLSYLP